MKKYEAVRQAEDCTQPLVRHDGGWRFRHRDHPAAPWQESASQPRDAARAQRRQHLIHHARQLLGRPEHHENRHVNWADNL